MTGLPKLERIEDMLRVLDQIRNFAGKIDAAANSVWQYNGRQMAQMGMPAEETF
jgi:hypothetical protein